MFLLFACSPATVTLPDATATKPQATATMLQDTATPTTAPQVTPTATPTTAPQATPTAPLATQEPASFPLSERGPYFTGRRAYAFVDESRNGRKVQITLWYPALKQTDAEGRIITRDAVADKSGAPYPLILSSTKVAGIFALSLVSHGFAWASIDGIDTYYQMNEEMIEQPLDILFALDQVASSPLEGLEGMIDAEHAGAIGYSFDGYNALALSGARIDPKFYLAQCATPEATKKVPESAFSCDPARKWDQFAAHAGQAITASEDGLWQPMTDERIRAVIPMAGEGWWLFGDRGLASVDRPTLIMVATKDGLYPENVLIFEHLGTADKALISFVGRDHMMVYERKMVARMAHFAVAFFGYHLQGREDLAWYFSEDFIAQHDDLAWGVYVDE